MSISSAQNNLVDIPPGLIEALRSVQHDAVLTGAGISAEMAIPINASRYGYGHAYTNTDTNRNTTPGYNS